MPRRSTGRPPGRPRHPEPLTPAEQRVLQHLRERLPNAEIGVRLGVSPDAVKYHVSNMLGKLGLENREQLAAWREPSGLKRVWAGIAGLGWKLAGGGGAVTAGVVAVAIVWGLTRDETEEPARFDPEALAVGVLTVGIDGQPANGNSTAPSISADGRYIAFESDATNLVPNDTNSVRDIFLIDRLTNETRRISMGMGGQEPNGPSFRPSISADGKWLAFDSQASNLVKDDVNGELDRAVSLLSEETRRQFEPPSSSGATFLRESAGHWAGSDVFVVELKTRKPELVSVTSSGERGNLGSFGPSISGDGRYVAFESIAPNLRGRPFAVAGPPAGYGSIGSESVFVRDLKDHKTTHVSRAEDAEVEELSFGGGLPKISRDGDTIGFVSRDARLADKPFRSTSVPPSIGGIYLWSRGSDRLRLVPMPAAADFGRILQISLASRPAMSADGKLLAFGGSVLVRDQSAPDGLAASSGIWLFRVGEDTARLVKGTERAREGPLPLSFDDDGTTMMTSVIDDPNPNARLHGGSSYDVATGELTPLALPPGLEGSWLPIISGDGRWITATKLGDTRTPSGLPGSQIVVFPR
jgi:DNA-binding CsgD family transcriptional regulator